MPYSLDNYLVVGISSRALFDLEEENRIFETEGLAAYSAYQIEHEKDILKPGTGFQLARALLRINELIPGDRKIEIIIMSRNSADTSLRISNSMEYYGLDISRLALSGGGSIAPYLPAFKTDLFLSANEDDVKEAVKSGVAAGIICTHPEFAIDPFREIDQIRIAFDGDAVLFSDESEQIFQKEGIDAFVAHERENAGKALPDGPFARFLRTLSYLQNEYPTGKSPIRTALVTARNAPAHERVIRTLRTWGVRVDEAFFLGGIEKAQILRAFGAHIYFDDQMVHLTPAAKVVPAARVPLPET